MGFRTSKHRAVLGDSDLELVKNTFEAVGVFFAERHRNSYTYLFFCSEGDRDFYDSADIDLFVESLHFFEFDPEGKLASY